MQSSPVTVRAPRPLSVLWKWTGVSALFHVVILALLCGLSFWALQKREAAEAAKVAAEEAAAKKAEEAAAAAATPTPAPTATPEATPEPSAAPTATPVQAEKVLGIDETAKPEELPSSPFSATGDDLLKDLK